MSDQNTDIVTLLVVDDEELNRDMLGRRLQRHGYRVVTASSGQEALDAVSSGCDLVLLDVMMPEMSGLDVLREVRATHSPEQLPVIMVTARTDSKDVVEALDLGANDYITKPVDLAVALARIRAQIARSRAEQALRESQERYTLAVQGANDGLWDWKIGSGEVFYSQRWKGILGYGEDDSPRSLEAWLERVHPDDVERVRGEIEEHLRGVTGHLESEHRVRASQGNYRWVLARGLAVRDEQGRPVRIAGSLTDITEGKVADALTGLPNRVLFIDRLARLMEQERRRPDLQFAVMFLDLDRFKTINDSMGHQAGDQLLIQVARRIEHSVRTSDTVARLGSTEGGATPAVSAHTVARLGGDEFAIILGGLRQQVDATRVAQRILESFAGAFLIDSHEVYTTASIGIALSASSYQRPEHMLRDADTALYRAKAAGRGRCEVFDAAMREQAVQRLQVETDLRHAIDREEFVVHYQPIVSLGNRQVTGLEALVRWNHPKRGLILPSEFIPVAEDTGLIVPLGYWIMDRVCRQMERWSQLDPKVPPLTVGVNLSAKQLVLPDLVARMQAIVGEHQISPSLIEFEITESSMMSNPEAARLAIERLKQHGFRVSIDDFGTGYSSLSYLQQFPVDRLKIDRSFLQHAAGSSESEGIIHTIIALAEHLNLEVVAEGIEQERQADELEALNCGFGQGFYFSRPVSPDPLSRLLLLDDQEPESSGQHPDDLPGESAERESRRRPA